MPAGIGPYGRLPRDAYRFLRRKGQRVSDHWTDVYGQEHHAAFTAARMTRLDVVRETHNALLSAVADGATEREFLDALGPLLEERWTPPPAGGDVPHRLRRIFATNVRVADAAGQWDRIQRRKKRFPYLVYSLGPSVEHRPEHAAWAGLVLPAAHHFWHSHYPPNGWGCKCRVRAVTRAEAERLLANGGKSAPPDWWRDAEEWENPATGRTIAVPRGIDPGWEHNVGRRRARNSSEAYASSLERTIADMAGEPGDLAGRWARRHVLALRGEPEYRAALAGKAPDGVAEPVAVLGAAAAAEIGAARLLWLEQWAARKRHGGLRLGAGALAAARRLAEAGRPALQPNGRWRWDGEVDGRRWRLVADAAEGRVRLVSIHDRGPAAETE